ncbi:MAG: phenylalanine--tRNA ligase subunit beta [Holosporaceae bacterium]|jgi:phenylalanyl-tRNA synthetase beta chain|nr:phenylalanine--tRNA ligase subunit beta [Holosporaceae bacterium]
MRFSFNWLKHHLSTDLGIYEIADRLTSIGLEVESVQDPAVVFKNFKLARIKDAKKHPNSDRLQICLVEDCDGKEYNIVCGAANARAGLKTILALPGAVIPKSGETLKKSTIRGIASEGMMCSRDELGLSSVEDGIMEIDPNTLLSTSVGDVLRYGGGLLDISITPNRGDCFSIKGIARDLAAAGAGELLNLGENVCKPSFPFPVNVKYKNVESCSLYAPMIAFRVIRGVKNGKSPGWLLSALESAGMNQISPIVDLSNFWMVDNGRPTHIYDLGKIKGDLEVRFTKTKETFVDIKGNEHRLFPDMLVLADNESPLCLLGIMGGKKTACDENTTDILIESALFDPISISKTGTLLNLTSDSRTRFERGIDKDSCVVGLNGITKLILDNCGGEASEIFVIGEQSQDNPQITLRKTKLDSMSGCSMGWNASKLIIKKLGLKEIRSGEEESTFSVPGWRSDLNIEEDLVEEILRIRGYDNIPLKSIDTAFVGGDKILQRKSQIIGIKKLLAARGLSELITYSFTKQDYAEAFVENNKVINLINPISVDMRTMRPSLIPTLLQNAITSRNYGQANIGVFECGNVFHDSCEQEYHISGIRLGNICDRNWLEKKRPADVFDVKGDIFAILNQCKIDDRNITTASSAPSYYHPSRSGTILFGKKKIGYFGELHPKIGKIFDTQENIVCFEVLADQLFLLKARIPSFSGKIFPKISRDFAFLFPSKSSVGNVVSAIYQLDPIITKVSVFDCFDLNITQKSIGIAVTLDAITRTLVEEEAQAISEKIVKCVESAGGELRKK